MSLIIDICPECKLEYINEDDIAVYKWYCDDCRERLRAKKEDDTDPEMVIEI